jgi:hypothetical protein
MTQTALEGFAHDSWVITQTEAQAIDRSSISYVKVMASVLVLS